MFIYSDLMFTKATHMPNFLLIEDHTIARIGYKMFISEMFPSSEIIESLNFTEALQIISEKHFDVILLNNRLQEAVDENMIHAIRIKDESSKILIHSSDDEKRFAMNYIQAGANGFLSKKCTTDELKIAFEKLLNNEIYISLEVQVYILQQRSQRKIQQSNVFRLTTREQQVMQLLAQGANAAEIKSCLQISDSTLSTNKTRVFQKMGVTNIVELISRLRFQTNIQV